MVSNGGDPRSKRPKQELPRGGSSVELAGVQRDLLNARLTDRSQLEPLPCDFLKSSDGAAPGSVTLNSGQAGEKPCAREWTRAIEPDFEVSRAHALTMGIELETFLFDAETLSPLGDARAPADLQGQAILEELARRYEATSQGQSRLIQDELGPEKGHVTYGLFLSEGISYSLEPGGQLEIATPPSESLRETSAALRRAFELVEDVTAGRVLFLSHGTHPLTTPDFGLQVPKKRYRILTRYLASEPAGRGIDMMRHATTVQPNIDVGPDPESWIQAVRLTNELSPFFKALFPNSFYFRGRLVPDGMERQRIWSHLDASRTGIPPGILTAHDPSCCYAQWASQAFVFLIDGLPEAEQPLFGELKFCDWMKEGYKGTRPGLADWERHLATLFPELRLRRFLELRMFDSQPYGQIIPLLALVRGLLQSQKGRDAVAQGLSRWKELLVGQHRDALFEELVRCSEAGLKSLGEEDETLGSELLSELVLPVSARFAAFGSAQDFVRAESVLHPSRFFRV